MEDDYVCEYDSTWDTESDGDDPAGESQSCRSYPDKNKSSWTIWHHTPRNMRAAKDMQNYRRGYPNLTDECSEDKMNNLQFYLNKVPSAPDEIYIEPFLKEWKNDYKKLERVHSYIQWLFPLREPGVNYMASELTKKEIEAFKMNKDAQRRLVEAYELMLGFYGIRLVDKKTGEVKRAENWKERFGNLERNMHNNLRITRILKSLGELGFRHFQAPLVRFFLEETLVKKTMSNVKRSVLDYFLFAVLDKHERQKLVRFAYLHYEPKEKFVWCPRKIQKQFRKAAKNSEVVGKDEVSLHGKSKDGEGAAMEQKEDGMNSMAKTPKGNDKNKEQSKQPEESPEPPVETESVGNGNVEICGESNIGNTSNGNESPDMDRSPSLDTETTKHEATTDNEQNSTSVSEDASEKLDDMQMDKKTENPPKKKREDDEVPPNNHLAEDDPAAAGAVAVAVGHMEEKAAANKAAGQTSPSVHTPLKTSTHSPSLSSEREEKIPRTDFTQPLDKKEEEMSHENIPASSRMPSSKDVEEQRNGTEVILMELTPSSLDHNEGAS